MQIGSCGRLEEAEDIVEREELACVTQPGPGCPTVWGPKLTVSVTVTHPKKRITSLGQAEASMLTLDAEAAQSQGAGVHLVVPLAIMVLLRGRVFTGALLHIKLSIKH